MALSDCPPTIRIVKLGNPDAERDAINAAFQAVTRCLGEMAIPDQTGHSGEFLTTDGSELSWAAVGGGSGTVTSVAASGGTTGLTFSGSPVTTAGTLTLSGTLAIANGGTGQTTATAARNALLPSQGGHAGEVLTTDGSNVSWAAGGGSTTRAPGCVFSNGNLLLTGTLTSEIQLPYGGTIEAWTIAGDAAGDASIIVSHSTYAAYDTMTTLFTATCTGSNKAQATGISHAVSAGDILRFSGSGFALFTRVSITLEVN